MNDTIVLVLVVFLIIIVTIAPFVAYSVIRKGKKRKIREAYMSKASDYQVVPDVVSMTDNFFLGLDTARKKIFFSNVLNHLYVINLDEVRNCEAVNISHQVGPKKESTTVIDRISLRFFFHDKTNRDLELDLFTMDMNSILRDELQLTATWSERINNMVK